MGALHAGHLSLVERAMAENDIVVCSIFINPTQFNNATDLAAYPRMPEADLKLLGGAGCHHVFMPESEELYPNGPILLEMDFGSLETVMEGAFRPGHFRGMATVVHRLLSLVQPHTAYFGEKDFQQLVIVKELVRRLSMPVHIQGCPTLREADGLAMSSRNLLLDPDRRKAAALIFRGLSTAQAYIPHQRPDAVKALVRRYVEQSPLLSVEYIEIVDPTTLQPVTSWEGFSEVRGCIAVQTGGPRLIDNVIYTID